MRRFPALLAAALLSVPLAQAQEAPKKATKAPARPAAKSTAKPVAKSTAKPAAAKTKPVARKLGDRATQGAFGILQVAAPDAQAFIADWRSGTASSAITQRTVADRPLFVFIVFHGCKADADGACNVTADFTIRRPDGSVDNDHKDMAIWKRNAPEDPAKSVLGDGALGFGTDSEGPFGDYRIAAAVTDHVAGITLRTEQVITVAAGDAATTPAGDTPDKPAGDSPAASAGDAVPATKLPTPTPDGPTDPAAESPKS